MGRQESKRDRKIFRVTHDPVAAERPLPELLESHRPEPVGEGPPSSAREDADAREREQIRPDRER